MYLEPLVLHRLGQSARARGIPLVPRLCEALTFLIFHSTVPVAAQIGAGTRCGHRGAGIVIHPDARIGERCVIRVQVVVGSALSDEAPVIGDDVSIGAGAKILGAVRIGDRAVIGANAVVLTDVPPGALAVGVPARVREREEEPGAAS